MRAGGAEVDGRLCGRSMIAPTCAPGVRKSKERFSGRGTRPLREDRRLGGFAGGAEVEGEVCGTGDPSPTRGQEAGRIRRRVVRGWEVLLRQSLSQLR